MYQKTAKAALTPIRQTTQYNCMSTSMSMALRAIGVAASECTIDLVNQVMGARPMKGASWEQALACAQHFGCRATLTMPSTVAQLKAWTDAGTPVMIAWNPEGRDWSHASTVFDVTEDGGQTWVHIADPNIPDPDETVRVMSKADFYSKWYEKWPDYMVRRPACAIEREITVDGKQVMAREISSMGGDSKREDAIARAKKMAKCGKQARTITDRDGRHWGPKRGLEGPLPFKGGKVLYYNPRERGGSYYDPSTDMYLSQQEADRLASRRADTSRDFDVRGVVQAVLPFLSIGGYEGASGTPVKYAAGVTVKKLKDGRVVVNAGPAYKRDAKRLLEKAGWDWRTIEDRAGSWILPKASVKSVDEIVEALSGVDAELRRARMRVANRYLIRMARAKKRKKPQSIKDKMKIDKTVPKSRSVPARALIDRGGGGRHHNRDHAIEKGRSRKTKHKKKYANFNWKGVAQKLLDRNTGKSQDDFYYRAYMRAILQGADSGHIVKKFKGAEKARMDLIDEVGRGKLGGYEGNPDGKDIYPNVIDHGVTTEPLSGGHDIMRQLQNTLVHEQGDVIPQRPPSPAIARYSFNKLSLGKAAQRVALRWATRQENN